MSHKYVWYSLMINFTDGSLRKIHKQEYCKSLIFSVPLYLANLAFFLPKR